MCNINNDNSNDNNNSNSYDQLNAKVTGNILKAQCPVILVTISTHPHLIRLGPIF